MRIHMSRLTAGLSSPQYPRVREWLARVVAQADYVRLLDVPGTGAAT
jgi:hypothetical protein